MNVNIIYVVYEYVWNASKYLSQTSMFYNDLIYNVMLLIHWIKWLISLIIFLSFTAKVKVLPYRIILIYDVCHVVWL